MNQKVKLALAVVLAAACVFYAAFTIAKKRDAGAQLELQKSAMHELNGALRDGLRDYYADKGSYPEKLADLDAELLGGSDNKAKIVKGFIYTVGRRFYIVTWGLQWGDGPMQTHKEQAMSGKVAYVESYVDDVLQTRIEYPDGYDNPDYRVEKEYSGGSVPSVTTYRDGEVVAE